MLRVREILLSCPGKNPMLVIYTYPDEQEEFTADELDDFGEFQVRLCVSIIAEKWTEDEEIVKDIIT